MSKTLSTLLDTMGPLLEGRLSLTDAERALFGETQSPSRTNLRIYPRFCSAHRQTALSVFGHCREVLGARWDDTVERYFRAHPMHHVEINANGAAFAEFLRGETPAFLSELADFEWWEWQARTAPAEPTNGPIAPTVEIRPYHYDFIAWRQDPNVPPPERETLVVFWRDRSDQPRRERVYASELEVLRALHEGRAVAPSDVLADLRSAGIVL